MIVDINFWGYLVIDEWNMARFVRGWHSFFRVQLVTLTLTPLEEYEIFLICCILNQGGQKQSNIRKKYWIKTIESLLLSVKLSAFRGHAHAQFTDNICGGVCCYPYPRQNPFTPKRRHSSPTRNRNQRGGFRRVKEVSFHAQKHFWISLMCFFQS